MMRTSLRVIVALLLIAGAIYWYWDSKQAQQMTKLKRIEIAERLAWTPTSKEFDLPQGKMIVVQVPVPDQTTPLFGETRHCFVWRDNETKMSSMACDPRPEFVMADDTH